MLRLLSALTLSLFLSACGMSHMDHGSGNYVPSDIDTSQQPIVKPSEPIVIQNGDTIELTAGLVRSADGKYVMYAYNGQFPGPTLYAEQGTRFTVKLINKIDQPTTIHWHGIRLSNRNDGAAGMTQDAVESGDEYTYDIALPDEGTFWYHPHVREDTQQDMGLYGAIVVKSKAQNWYAPVNTEEVLMLDDLLLDANGLPQPYGEKDANYAMGRYGNTMLINGKTEYALSVPSGSVVRFRMINAANVRPFKINFGGQKMKLVGGDIGRFAHETFVDNVVLGPGDRNTVDVYFPKAGTYAVQQVMPDKTVKLGTVNVTSDKAPADITAAFGTLRDNSDVSQDIASYRDAFAQEPAHTMHLSVEMDGAMGGHMQHMQHGIGADGIEWNDMMPGMGAMMTTDAMKWKIIDEETKAENMDIHYAFERTKPVKIRIINDKDSPHPMQHPMHFHGQRFLVLSIDGVPTQNLSWEDTVLIPAGRTADILLDPSNPGNWMFHCHIAEHLTGGMMGMFSVE